MKTKKKKQEVLLIFDGSNCLRRGFHAVPEMKTSKGFHTNAIKGLINIVVSVFNRTKPTRVAFVMDRNAKTHRHTIFPEYKGTRLKDPDVIERLTPQRKPMYDLLTAMGIKVFHKLGVEADDIIGTLTRKAVKKGWKVIIVSNDKDFAQLLEDGVELWKYLSHLKDYTIITEENCEEAFGVPHTRIIDKLMMEGDKVDNIPGVHGIGAAALKKLIATHKRIEKADLSVLSKAQRASFEGCRKQFKLTRELVTINCDVMPVDLTHSELAEPDLKLIGSICKALEAPVIRRTVQTYLDSRV